MKLNIDKANKLMREVELRAAKAKRDLKNFEQWAKQFDEDERAEHEVSETGVEFEWELRQARADRRRLRALYD